MTEPALDPARAPHRGGLVLALGIVSLVVCQPLGIAPWLLANSDLADMRAGRMDPSGRSVTEAGKICGIVAVALFAVGLVFGLLWVAVAGLAIVGGAAAH